MRRLPESQRSALLMREMEGLSYEELANALETTVPAVKSLLVRARIGLVEAAEARDTACTEIRRQLLEWRSYQAGNDFISETFVLGRGPGFLVRANFWTPQPEAEVAREIHSRVNSVYRIVHNHSFPFVTVGYWGPGYATDIYEVDAE